MTTEALVRVRNSERWMQTPGHQLRDPLYETIEQLQNSVTARTTDVLHEHEIR